MALDYSKWKYVVTAMDGTIPAGAGEIVRPSGRSYNDPLNGMRTCGCSIPIDHPRANFVQSNDCLMKLYRQDRNGNWQLLLTGDVLSTEEKAEGNVGQISIVAVDPFFRINKRLLGMAVNAQNQGTGFTIGTPSVQVDLAIAVQQALQQVNSDFFSGCSLGTVQNCGTVGVVGPLYAVFAGPTIQQICATLGGPDFWIQPLEPSGTMPSTIIGQMNIGFARGTNRPNAIFEYSMGKRNVNAYTRLLTKQNACNHAAALPTGWPSGVGSGDAIATYDDTTSQNIISRFDDIVSTDVANLQLRQILCQESVSVRKQKQQQITFTPNADDIIDYTVDYNTGDVVTVRAYDPTSKTYRYNGLIRVYGVALTLSEDGSESVELTLIPDSVSGGVS